MSGASCMGRGIFRLGCGLRSETDPESLRALASERCSLICVQDLCDSRRGINPWETDVSLHGDPNSAPSGAGAKCPTGWSPTLQSSRVFPRYLEGGRRPARTGKPCKAAARRHPGNAASRASRASASSAQAAALPNAYRRSIAGHGPAPCPAARLARVDRPWQTI